LPSNMDNDFIDLEPNEGLDILEREERCQKAIRTIAKAIIMRLLICGLLIWIVLRTDMEIWVAGLMLLVMLMNVTGILPLAVELKKRRAEWKALLEEE